jgi:hypothetical protein
MMTTVRVAALTMMTDPVVVSMMTSRVSVVSVTTTVRAADLTMKTDPVVVSMTTSRVSAVSVTTIGRAAALTMTTVQDVALMKTVPVVVAALTTMTDPAAVSTTKKSRAVVARVMFARKTRCTTVRELLARFASTNIWPTVAFAHAAKPTTSSRPVA